MLVGELMSASEELKVFIPLPSPVPRGQGIHSTSEDKARITTRFSKLERELIEKEAEELGISLSYFIRWTALHVALALEAKRDHARSVAIRKQLGEGHGITVGPGTTRSD